MSNPGAPQESRDKRPLRRTRFLDWGIPFYEGILARDPNHIEVLQVLGHLYTKKGQTEKGLEADLRLSILRPTDPIVRYNLACSHALLHHTAEALDALEQAVTLGFTDGENMAGDPDLESLREEHRFKAILASISSSGKPHKAPGHPDEQQASK